MGLRDVDKMTIWGDNPFQTGAPTPDLETLASNLTVGMQWTPGGWLDPATGQPAFRNAAPSLFPQWRTIPPPPVTKPEKPKNRRKGNENWQQALYEILVEAFRPMLR